jgi:hyperosmotically inducible periplasmic protein
MSRLLSSTAICIFGLGLSIFAQTPKAQTAAENTKVNRQDRNNSKPTADQQKQNSSDVEITRRIRRSLVQDKSLSTSAKNIKVITQNGNVTLRGPVQSEEEKKSIETKASEVAGPSNVKSELQIAAKQTKKTVNPKQ